MVTKLKGKNVFLMWVIVIIILIIIASFFLIKNKNSNKNKDLANKNILKIWIMPNSSRPVQDLESVLAGFKKQNPKVQIEITTIDWGSAWLKLNAAAISKDGPDIVQLGTTWVGVFSGMDALTNLNDKVSEIGGSSAFLPAAWETCGIKNSGQVTAIPWFVDARVLYYRTDVFKKLGLTVKDLDTWASFENTLKKIRDANLTINNIKVAPLGVPGKNDWNVVHNVAPWIWAAGGDFLSADSTKSAINSPEAVAGLNFYVGLTQKGYIPKSCLELNTAQISAKFNEGEFAMYFDTPAEVKILSLPAEQGGASGTMAAKNYGVAVYPKGPKGRFTFFGGSDLAIFKFSKNKELAWQLVKYLVSKEAQIRYANDTGFIPARQDCFNDSYFTSDPKRLVFTEAVKYGRVYPCIPAWGPIEPILTRHIGIIWDNAAGVFGQFSPQVIVDELNRTGKEMNIYLKEANKN
ncbi:MAG: sugar ABC transporter substrate-binding protein [Candidatus Margulisiibacteriota bacterium]|jgi:multiple sugar transport system substrate-binding protein